MTSRITTATVTFAHPFRLDEIEHALPAGDYRIETEEEMLDSASFVAYRRVSTHIFVPSSHHAAASMEMRNIHPKDLADALSRDQAAGR